MFFEFLDHIRQKPRAVREHYAFMFAATFVGIVALLWVFTLPSRFDSIISVTEEGLPESTVPPFSSLWDQVTGRDGTAEAVPVVPTEVAVATSSSMATVDPPLILSDENLEQLRSVPHEEVRDTAGVVPTPRTVQIATTSAAREAATE